MEKISRKGVAISVTAFIFLLVIGTVLSYGARLVSLGTAYKAKMLCSEVFVAERDTAAVLVDLAVDDLVILQFIDASIDNVAKTTTASLYGFAESKVRYRKKTGCALVSNIVAPIALEAGKRGQRESTGYMRPEADKSVEPLKLSDADNPRLTAVLNAAFLEPDSQHPGRTRAIIVLHKGQIVGERYATGIGPDTPQLGWSMTKSVMNALVGILVKEGRLTLSSPITTRNWQAPDDPRRNITLEHLLHMSSGLAFNEDMADPLADVSYMILRERDMASFASNKPLEAEPGSRWQYSSGSTIILAEFLCHLLGNEVYGDFPREALFEPLGMTSAVLETDAHGTFVGSSFMYATAREWARFGLLYLQDGIWDGKRILPEGWVQYTRTPAPSDPEAAYGAHFWLQLPKEYRGKGDAMPEDAFHAVGHEGQFVTIVPSHDAVIVRLGKTRYPQAWQHDLFVRNVLAALR
ncbi:MAG: serine hydrolase [Pseudomonadota bacterium]